MHKALRTMCGIPQTLSHTSIITVIKMRTERHHVDLDSQLFIVLDVEAELALAWDMLALRPSRTWLKIQLVVIHLPPTITALLGLEIHWFPPSLYLAQLWF